MGWFSKTNNLSALLRARRQFDVMGLAKDAIATDPALALVKRSYDKWPNASGLYINNVRIPPYQPIPTSSGQSMPRAAATYILKSPELDRQVRRHEVMHGIHHASLFDPEIERAIPFWARGQTPGSFRGELLARLASRQPKSLTHWPLATYAEKFNDPLYAMAAPAQAVARTAQDNPILMGMAIGTGVGTAVGVPWLIAMGRDSHEQPLPSPSDSPVRGVRVLSRLAAGDY